MEKMVKIPASTLSMLEQMIFKQNGTDLSYIIRDITLGATPEETALTAINIALVHQGYIPNVDVPSRIFFPGNKNLRIMSCRGFSAIRNVAIYAVYDVFYEDDIFKFQKSEMADLSLEAIDHGFVNLEDAVNLVIGIDDKEGLMNAVIENLSKVE